jgi:hypothetical protein
LAQRLQPQRLARYAPLDALPVLPEFRA